MNESDARNRPLARRRWWALAAVGLLAAACSNTKTESQGGGLPETDPDKPVTEQVDGEMSIGDLPEAPQAADPNAEPIKVGLINQEDVDIGSFPEVREGAEGAVEFINAELGGVDGRPIELISCKANFTPERSQKCAQQMVQEGAVVVLGGLDIMSNASIPVLEQNNIPYIGGIPVNLDEMRSPLSFQFSGGSPGAMVAFAEYSAKELGADKVTVAYADYPPIKTAAVDYGVKTLKTLGVSDVQEVPFPIVASDYAPVVAKANEGNPDAVIVTVTDKACVDVMKQQERYDAQLFLVGACAGPPTLDAAGPAAEGVIFNVEGPLTGSGSAGVDNEVYAAAMARYRPDAEAASAATVSFRAMMNLWSVMVEVGADNLNADSLVAAMKATEDHPSFTGHPFTCDGQQVPELPSMCSPQQILAQFNDGALEQITEDWIDVPALVAQNNAAG